MTTLQNELNQARTQDEFKSSSHDKTSLIGKMVRCISDGKWKYIFTLNFNQNIGILTKDYDLWKTGNQLEKELIPYLGKDSKHLLCLKFETTKKGQLHVHGLLGGDISIDEGSFRSVFESLELDLGFSVKVTSVHFEKYIPLGSPYRVNMNKTWIEYMFKEPDVNSKCKTMYYISRRVFDLIRKNNEEIQNFESGKISLEQISQWWVARFHSLLSDQFKKRYLGHSLECLFSGKGVF
jgi:hypothetical protein